MGTGGRMGGRTGPCLTGAVAAGPGRAARSRLPPQQAPGQAAPQGAHGGAGGSDLAAAGLGRPAEALRARPSPGTGQVSVPPLKAAAGIGRQPLLYGASRYGASRYRASRRYSSLWHGAPERGTCLPGASPDSGHPSVGHPRTGCSGLRHPRPGASPARVSPKASRGGSRACTHPPLDPAAWEGSRPCQVPTPLMVLARTEPRLVHANFSWGAAGSPGPPEASQRGAPRPAHSLCGSGLPGTRRGSWDRAARQRRTEAAPALLALCAVRAAALPRGIAEVCGKQGGDRSGAHSGDRAGGGRAPSVTPASATVL